MRQVMVDKVDALAWLAEGAMEIKCSTAVPPAYQVLRQHAFPALETPGPLPFAEDLEVVLEGHKGLGPADGDVIDVGRLEAREIECRPDGADGKRAVLVLAAEPLLGAGKNQLAVLQQARRRFMHGISNAQDVHRLLSP